MQTTLQTFAIFKSVSRTGIQPDELAPATFASLDGVHTAIKGLNDLTALIPPLSLAKSEPSTEDDDEDSDDDPHRSLSARAGRQLRIGGIINSRFPGIPTSLAKRLEASIEDRRRRLRRRRPLLRLPQPDLLPELFSDPVQVVDVPISKDESINEKAIHHEVDDTPEVIEATEDNLYLELPRSYKGESTYRCGWCNEQLDISKFDALNWRYVSRKSILLLWRG
jgi:hypothetical protein